MRPLITILLATVACDAPEAETLLIDAVVLQSDYVSGAISFGDATLPVDGDSALRVLDDGVAVLQRGEGDNLLWLDADLRVRHQWQLPANSNPQDLLRHSNDALISLYQRPELLRINLQNGAITGRIDLQAYSDEDDRPEASAMLKLDEDRGVVAVQNLDFSGIEPTPPEASRLLIVDMAAMAVDGTIDIPPNPFGDLHRRGDDHVVLACNGDWSVQSDVGLIRVNLVSGEHELLVSETELGGNLLDISPFEGGWLLLIADEDFRQTLRRFDDDNGLSEPLPSPTAAMGCLGLVDGQTWVCDRTAGAHGLRRVLPGLGGVDDQLEATALPPLRILPGPRL